MPSLLLLIRNLCKQAIERANAPNRDFGAHHAFIADHAVRVLDYQRLEVTLHTRDGDRTFRIIIQEQ